MTANDVAQLVERLERTKVQLEALEQLSKNSLSSVSIKSVTSNDSVSFLSDDLIGKALIYQAIELLTVQRNELLNTLMQVDNALAKGVYVDAKV